MVVKESPVKLWSFHNNTLHKNRFEIQQATAKFYLTMKLKRLWQSLLTMNESCFLYFQERKGKKICTGRENEQSQFSRKLFIFVRKRLT